MKAVPFEQSADYVQSLARGLQVLRAFHREQPSASLSQIAKSTGLSRAVVRRLLMTLQHLGYAGHRDRDFFLTPRVLELGYSYLSSLDLSELALQAMEQLAQRVSESCSMAVLDGDDIVYVLRIPVRRVISIALGVGARLPAYAASMGRVMLADLPETDLARWLRTQKFRRFTPHTICTRTALAAELARVRQQGYALVVRELELGLCSAAVPIHDANGRVVAALNVGMPYSEEAPERATRLVLPALRDTQQVIEQVIARVGWSPSVVVNTAHA